MLALPVPDMLMTGWVQVDVQAESLLNWTDDNVRRPLLTDTTEQPRSASGRLKVIDSNDTCPPEMMKLSAPTGWIGSKAEVDGCMEMSVLNVVPAVSAEQLVLLSVIVVTVSRVLARPQA